MDEFDRASEQEMLFRNHAIEAVRSIFSGESLLYCEDCDEKIPDARRKLIQGCRTCVRCAREREKNNGN